MTVRARILYEDRRTIVGAEYGPHDLVLACVADRVGGDLFDLRRRVLAVPLNGFGNVKKALASSADYRRDGAELFALVDGDEAWRHLGLGRTAADDEVCAALIGAPPPEGVRVHVLRENVETLLRAVVRATGGEEPARKPRPTQRDRLLIRVATSSERGLRDAVLTEVPAVAALVADLAGLLTA